MNRLRVNLFVGVVAAMLLALLLAPAVAQAAAWSVVASPNATPGNNELHGVASVSTNDVWAVGTSFNASGVEQTFIEHWNGKQWSIVASPSPSTQTNFLLGVTTVSTNDVWAVGSFRNASGAFQTLTLHWDGT